MTRTQIALSIGASTTAEARRTFERVAHQVDLVELRLDTLQDCDLRELLKERPGPVIVTNRPTWEGGHYQGDEPERLSTLLEAAQLGAEHVDVELDCADFLAGKDLADTRLIVSKHDFEKMPEMARLCEECRAAKADIAKVVGAARNVTDPIQALNVLRQALQPTIALAMGRQGLLSRVLAFKCGAYLTFASLEPGHELAPGQMALNTLRSVYHVESIDADTAVLGYLAPAPIAEDGLATANEKLRLGGRNAVMVPLEIDTENPIMGIQAYQEFGFSGFAIHPAFSECAMRAATAVTASAKRRARVDGIVQQGDRWVADVFSEAVPEGLASFWVHEAPSD